MAERSVDLRSDTITLPTAEMREAMASAAVGDDVYGEDPTVNRLQEMAAARVGMEAALFVASGTMGNTCALLAHTHCGDEVLFESLAHMYVFECANYAAVAGLGVRTLDSEYGAVKPEDLTAAMRPLDIHFPPTRLLCVENTHNNHGGAVLRPQELAALTEAARSHELRVHMDGARLFNAAVAAQVDVREYTRQVDSVMFCLSKGLSAPVGSLLCGSRTFIESARRMRKRLGGAMRQAGILAAAGIVALERMVDRLKEDHVHAARLAQGLADIEGLHVHMPPLPSNMVNVNVSDHGWVSRDLIERWQPLGIWCNPRPPSSVRLVTHRHISADDVDYVIGVTRDLVAAD